MTPVTSYKLPSCDECNEVSPNFLTVYSNPRQSGLGNPSNITTCSRGKSAYIPIEKDESDNLLVQIQNTTKAEEDLCIVSEVMHYRLKELVNNEKSNILQAPHMPATYS